MPFSDWEVVVEESGLQEVVSPSVMVVDAAARWRGKLGMLETRKTLPACHNVANVAGDVDWRWGWMEEVGDPEAGGHNATTQWQMIGGQITRCVFFGDADVDQSSTVSLHQN
jgi:hypothetical protein